MSNETVVILTESGVWTCPKGVTEVKVECWGAGSNAPDTERGGGGGGYARREAVAVTPNEEYPYAIGEGAFSPLSPTHTQFEGDYETTIGRSASWVNGAVPLETDGTTRYSGGAIYESRGGGGAGSEGSGGNAGPGLLGAGGYPDGGDGGARMQNGNPPGGGAGAAMRGARGQIRLTYTLPPPRIWWRKS